MSSYLHSSTILYVQPCSSKMCSFFNYNSNILCCLKKLTDTFIYLIILQNFLRETIIYKEAIQNKYIVDPAFQIVVGEDTKA